MTNIQVQNATRKENERANRAREDENRRHNVVAEREEERSNKERERLNRNVEKRQQISTLADIWQRRQENKGSAVSNLLKAIPVIGKVINDPKWYEVSPQITSDVASIPAFQPTGTIPAMDDAIGTKYDIPGGTDAVQDEGHRFAVAGYCHFPYLPTIGNSFFNANNSDAANITAQNVYSFVRLHNSGAKNYERADYMMYLLAVDSPISYHAWMKRLYGLLNYANVYNKYLPKHIINDMNVDYMDLSNNIANFRAYINAYAVRINSTLAIPSRMPYYVRHQFLNTYMFSDSKSRKHQLYFFSPKEYFVWKIDPNNQATMLDLENPWSYTGASKLTFNDIANFGNYLLDTLLSEEDVGLMVGDTVKAFGEEEMASVPEVSDGYSVEIVTSDEILDQITNIKFLKKNLVGYHVSTSAVTSIVGYEPTNSTVVASHRYAFRVYQDTTDQRIYQPSNMEVDISFVGAPGTVNPTWNDTGTGYKEEILVFNDGENEVELNFLTDDTSPSRVMTSTRLTPVVKTLGVTVIRNSGIIDKIAANLVVTACGSEVILNGYTTVLYWDSANEVVVPATYEIFDGMVEFASSNSGSGVAGTPFTGNECFISDFDYHPCVNIYHTIPSGNQSGYNGPWIRRYAKLWDRNVSTHVAQSTLSQIHAAAMLGEFNVASLGLKPRFNMK